MMSNDVNGDNLTTNARFTTIGKIAGGVLKYGIWPAPFLVAFGLIYIHHSPPVVASQMPIPKSGSGSSDTVESLAGFSLFFGISIFVVILYAYFKKFWVKRGKLLTRTSKAFTLLATLVLMVIAVVVLLIPAESIRWKLDPIAKVKYDAEAATIAAEIAAQDKVKQDAIAAVNLKKLNDQTQALAAKKAADTKANLDTQAAMKKAEKEVQVQMNLQSRKTLYGGLIQSDYLTVKGIRDGLTQYISEDANFTQGLAGVEDLINSCKSLGILYGGTQDPTMTTPNRYFERILNEGITALQEVQSSCISAINSGQIVSIHDSAGQAATARYFFQKLVTEIRAK